MIRQGTSAPPQGRVTSYLYDELSDLLEHPIHIRELTFVFFTEEMQSNCKVQAVFHTAVKARHF